MDAATYLRDYARKTEEILNALFTDWEKEAAIISPITAEMMRIYRNFVGGKGIRGSLTKLGYECFGGKNKKAILKASLMVEITHSFLLMHDDIMDQDILRRGMSTIHVRYEDLYRQRYTGGDPKHYGMSMAVNLGDAGLILSHLILADSQFPSEIKEKVLRRFNQTLLNTAFGQAIDLSYELSKKITEEDIFRVHHYKTANYTITGPLQYGALFAGASEREIEKIEKYGLPAGIAFQLRDDELGLFSDEKTLGKPVGGDVKENKNTLLHIKALEWARGEERKFLEYAYGNRNLTAREIERVRKMTIKTGALAYSQKTARDLVEKGKKFVLQITSSPKWQKMLSGMADLMIERTS